MDFGELEAVMERFLWQSYPQHLQSTLFHAERIAPLRKKSLQERLDAAYEFKKRGDDRIEEKKWREAVTQYEFAYGLFKYCDKAGKKISMHDDTKAARELRQEQLSQGTIKDDAFTQFWLEVDEMMCSCLTLIATAKLAMRHPPSEEALAATNEALEFRPNHVPALYRRSQAHLLMENYGDAVRDAKDAYYYADEQDKFDMWKYRKHVYERRRQETLFWGMVGFIRDLPWTIASFPWTFAAMAPKQQALTVLLIAASVGWYQMPRGTIRAVVFGAPRVLGDVAAADNLSAAATQAGGNASASDVGSKMSGAAGAMGALRKQAAEFDTDAAQAASTKAAESKEERRQRQRAEKAAKAAQKQAEKERKAAEKAAAKAAKEAAKQAAKKAAVDAKAAKDAAKQASVAKETAPAVMNAAAAATSGGASAAEEELIEIEDYDETSEIDESETW